MFYIEKILEILVYIKLIFCTDDSFVKKKNMCKCYLLYQFWNSFYQILIFAYLTKKLLQNSKQYYKNLLYI